MTPLETLKLRVDLLRRLRVFFDTRGFLEVETPVLQPLYVGASARPFVTHDNALDIPLYHHERWDGEGSPNQLSGESIPLAARVAAVADSLDTLTSCRAGGEALDWEVAVAEIVDGSGTKFDPEVVQAFRGALPRLREVWEGLGERAPHRSADAVT